MGLVGIANNFAPQVHQIVLRRRASHIIPISFLRLQLSNIIIIDSQGEFGFARDVDKDKVKAFSCYGLQSIVIFFNATLPSFHYSTIIFILFLVIGFGEIVSDNFLFFNVTVAEIDGKFDETLPNVQLVGQTYKGLKESQLTSRILLG